VEYGEETDVCAQVFGIGGEVRKVSAVARKRMPYITFLFCQAIAAIC
jgi:hypothetical protein